jgi:hypothetical protein
MLIHVSELIDLVAKIKFVLGDDSLQHPDPLFESVKLRLRFVRKRASGLFPVPQFQVLLHRIRGKHYRNDTNHVKHRVHPQLP